METGVQNNPILRVPRKRSPWLLTYTNWDDPYSLGGLIAHPQKIDVWGFAGMWVDLPGNSL